MPDAKTVWLYREQLSQAGVIDALFDDFDGYLKTQGYQAMGGQIIDASIVAVPNSVTIVLTTPRSSKARRPRSGRTRRPAASERHGCAVTKKHGKSHYGYKNHLNIDRRHKLIRRYSVTDASVHDSQAVDDLLTTDNTASGVWADSAYRSKDIEEKIKEKGLTSRIHRKACRNRPLRDWRRLATEVVHGFGSG